jgi:hypothetical protein
MGVSGQVFRTGEKEKVAMSRTRRASEGGRVRKSGQSGKMGLSVMVEVSGKVGELEEMGVQE